MAFSEEMNEFVKTHPFTKIYINGILTKYLLCGNIDSKLTLPGN